MSRSEVSAGSTSAALLRLMRHPPTPAQFSIFVVAYIVTGGLAKGLAIIPGVAITFWPPAGIFVATLLLAHRSTWLWWILAGCIGELSCNEIWFHNPLGYALLYFSGNALAALTAAALINAFNGRRFRFESLEEVLAFAVFGGAVAPTVSATVISLVEVLRERHAFHLTWPLVWLGDSSGLLVSTPLAFVAAHAWRERARIGNSRLIEAGLITVALCALCVLALKGVLPTLYMVMPPLLWAAVRFQLKGAASALGIIALLTALFAATGAGKFDADAELMHDKAVALQIFFGVAAVSSLCVAALSLGRHQALQELETANAELESRVAERTATLRENEERLRFVLAASQTGTWIIDLATGRLDCSSECRANFGVLASEAFDTVDHLRSRIHPEDASLYEQQIQTALSSGSDYEAEYRIVLPDDQVRWILVRGRAIGDSPARATRMMGISLDITHRKQIEQSLTETARSLNRERERLAVALRAGSLGVYEWHLGTQEVWWSPEMYPLYRVDPATFTPTVDSFVARIHPEDREELWRRTVECIEQRKVFTHEYRILCPDGEIRWIFNRSHVALDSSDKVQRITGVAADITDRKAIEQALRQADRRKDEFLATLAHELRNPLAALMMSVELLDRIGSKESVQVNTRIAMRRQMRQLTSLVDDLLDISRITRDKIVLKRQRVELVPLLQRAIEDNRSHCESRKHRLTTQWPDTDMIVNGDPVRLTQVVGNLLNNACKYTPEGGSIALHASFADGQAIIEVIDSGVGIAAEDLSRVFGLFEQIKGDGHLSSGGLGIGLSLVKRLVEMHGGSVAVFSDGRGKGATFTVRLPAEQSAVERVVRSLEGQSPVLSPHAIEPPALVGSSQRRVLVVDDNTDAALALTQVLTLSGNRTQVVHDGPEAIEAARQFRPDVVLLDIGLPSMTGHDVCRAICAEALDEKPLMVAVTGWGQDHDRQRSAEAGFDHHLVKPIDYDALTRLLEALPSAPRPTAVVRDGD